MTRQTKTFEHHSQGIGKATRVGSNAQEALKLPLISAKIS